MPSVPKIFSGGSPGAQLVMQPISVMPQPDSTCAPSRAVARSTSALGIGAPADRKMRKRERSCSASAGRSARSARKGVEAIVKVAPVAAMLAAASAGTQMSRSTAVTPSMIGSMMPYMKPV